ncbi:MAG: hypothetical protein PHD58_03235 [Anaerolineales bacterium]|nr:hypothetical protein [Anaerolineales bacterium]
MTDYKLGCDAHKRYSQFTVLDNQRRFDCAQREDKKYVGIQAS